MLWRRFEIVILILLSYLSLNFKYPFVMLTNKVYISSVLFLCRVPKGHEIIWLSKTFFPLLHINICLLFLHQHIFINLHNISLCRKLAVSPMSFCLVCLKFVKPSFLIMCTKNINSLSRSKYHCPFCFCLL